MKRREIIRQLTAKKIAHDPNASKAELLALLNPVQNKVTHTVNYAGGRGKIQVTFNAADESPVQILINEDIGKDPWSGEGVTEKEISNLLNEIKPNTRQLDFLTNSAGGYVHVGTAIRNILDQWPGQITNTIIGVAASTASWCIPADTTRAYKNSQIFAHRAMAAPFGNVDDLQDAIDFLNKTDGQIADMYAEVTGKSADEMLDMMKGKNGDGTLMTGQEALEIGLVDELIDGEAKNQFSTEQINAMKKKLAALNSQRITAPKQGGDNKPNNQPQENTVKRSEYIALLNSWGCKLTDDASLTDARISELINLGKDGALKALNLKTEQAPVAPPTALNADDRALLDNLRNQVAESRRREVRNALTVLASADGGQRIAVNEIDAWEKQALAATDGPEGNPILNSLKKLPEQTIGVPPLSNGPDIEPGSDSFKDVQTFVLKNGPEFRRQFLGKGAQNELPSSALKEIGARAVLVAHHINKHKKMLVEMFNANSISPDLQRQLILQDMLEAYALNLAPLDCFSIKYESVPLQGNDQVAVPYFPLQATASTSFVKGTGYTTKSDWLQSSRKVTIGGDGDAATNGDNATAGTCKDRLFQAIDFTSYDMRRQPYLNIQKLAMQAANKLGVDIASQIYSRVIVTGNFGAAVKTVIAAAFSPDDVADLAEYADTAEWPAIARSLVLNNTYKTPLLKDATFKNALSYGSTDPIRKAMIQEAYGFQNMYFVPNLSGKLAANTSGWINHQSAVLVAFAPIMPTEEVRNLLTSYDVAVEPRSGAVLEYRKFGDATKDQSTEVIESSFGAAKGVDAALKIIKSA